MRDCWWWPNWRKIPSGTEALLEYRKFQVLSHNLRHKLIGMNTSKLVYHRHSAGGCTRLGRCQSLEFPGGAQFKLSSVVGNYLRVPRNFCLISRVLFGTRELPTPPPEPPPGDHRGQNNHCNHTPATSLFH